MDARKRSLIVVALVVVLETSLLAISDGWSQQPVSNWPFPMSYDSVTAAPRTHKVLYEDAHIRFVEVTRWPGDSENMNGDPYPAVIAADAVMPTVADGPLDAKATQYAATSSVRSTPPSGKDYPWCETLAPQGPHATTVVGDFPQHFYRVEYKRIDAGGFAANWKTWYPWMLDPLKPVKDLVPGPQLGPPYSKEWPYPIAFDAAKAAPNNHYVRYEDDHVQILEVVVRTGGKENLHGHPYRSVFAFDLEHGAVATGTEGGQIKLYPATPAIEGPTVRAPEGLTGPQCDAADPEAPHQGFVTEGPPVHFYRIQFKRIDGDAIRSKWREWYPQPAKLEQSP